MPAPLLTMVDKSSFVQCGSPSLLQGGGHHSSVWTIRQHLSPLPPSPSLLPANTFIVLSAVRRHCGAGSGFEVSYRSFLHLAPLADSAAAAQRCTTVQVLVVLLIGFLLPSCALYMSEWRARCRFALAAGRHMLPYPDPLWARLCDALLLLLPVAAMMASLALTQPNTLALLNAQPPRSPTSES